MPILRTALVVLALFAPLAMAQEPPATEFGKHIKAAQEKLQAGEYDAAIEELDAALKIASAENELASVYALRAIANESAEHYEKAAADFDEAIDRIQNNPELYYRRAQVRDMLGDLEGAIEDYTQLTVLATNSPAGYLGRAQDKAHLGDYKGALEDLEAVIFLQPDGPDGYRLQARVKMGMGDIEGAKKDFATALEKAPDDRKGWMHFSRGLALYDLGEPDAALADLRKAIELAPEEHEYARFYVYLCRAAKGEGEAAAEELKAYLDTREKKDDWYCKVGGFLDGALTAEQLLAAAKADDPFKTRQQECEAHWYVAAKALIAGDKETARKHIDACLATKQYNFIEFDSAGCAKKRLEG